MEREFVEFDASFFYHFGDYATLFFMPRLVGGYKRSSFFSPFFVCEDSFDAALNDTTEAIYTGNARSYDDSVV